MNYVPIDGIMSHELCLNVMNYDKISFKFHAKYLYLSLIHCPPRVKVQPVLMLSCFVHYSRINEHKGIKLS